MATKKIFSGRTFRQQKVILKREIMTATQINPTIRKEMARVFQMANRRIQNVEKSGLLSPAVVALNKQDITRYTKFSTKNDSWFDLKQEYAKAVTFLNQPTSTASGTREYARHIKKAYDLTDDEYKAVMDKYLGKLNTLKERDYVERYLMRYKDFTGELEQTAKSAASQMESEAVQLIKALDNNVESAANTITESTTDWSKALTIESEAKRLEDELNSMR